MPVKNAMASLFECSAKSSNISFSLAIFTLSKRPLISGYEIGISQLSFLMTFVLFKISYSAFFENDRKTPTGLKGYLTDHKIKKVYKFPL